MEKRKEKGQGLVEFALILPILLLVIIGTIEFARIFLIYVNVSNAAREGARYGMVNPTDYIGINQRVTNAVVLSIPSNLSVLIRYDTGPGGTEYTDPNDVAVGHRVIVEVQYRIYALTPIFAPFVPDDFKVDVRNSRTIQSLKGVYITPSPAPGITTTPATATATPGTPASTATNTPSAPTNTPGGPTNTPTNTPLPTSTPTPRPLIPIVITKPLWQDTNVVRGTGEPNQIITLRIVQTGYQISGVIDASGNFMFTVWPLLVGGHTVIVQGYGSQDLAIVQMRTPTPTPTRPPTDPYISVSAPANACTNEQFATITVIGGNWSSAAKNMYLYWDGNLTSHVCVATLSGGNFTCTFDAFVTVGTHTITGIAKKSNGSVVGAPATVTFSRPCSTPTPSPSPTPSVLPDLRITGIRLQNSPPLGTYENLRVTVSVQNTGTVDVASLFWVDLYANATGVLTSQVSVDYVAINAIAAGSTVSFTMYVPGGFKTVGTHTLQAMVDTWNQIRETNEANNISALLPVTVTVDNPAPTPTPTPAGIVPPPGTIQGVTYLNGPPQSNVSVYVYAADGRLVGSGRSDVNGNYTITNIPAGTYTVVGELRLANILYRGQVAPVNVVGGATTTGVNIDLVMVP